MSDRETLERILDRFSGADPDTISESETYDLSFTVYGDLDGLPAIIEDAGFTFEGAMTDGNEHEVNVSVPGDDDE